MNSAWATWRFELATTRAYFNAENRLPRSLQRERTPRSRGFWLYLVNPCKWQPFCRILPARHFMGSYLRLRIWPGPVRHTPLRPCQPRLEVDFLSERGVFWPVKFSITTKMSFYVLRLPEDLHPCVVPPRNPLFWSNVTGPVAASSHKLGALRNHFSGIHS